MTRAPHLSTAHWRKSSYSAPQGSECVEVAPGFTIIPVRDSKDPNIGYLTVAPASWSALLSTLRTA
ncbi:DUF397 domain-containing protein [Streptomyces sp. SID3343]|uniref:DUF397 domain-containing protein n=1 Tax=Streptomyces sp. SID3343 TaxID=2690260 RepID=UPI0013688D80|nr:DUF397 domain-containing protein [Streptomyces sp. SID3343]MYV97040.1 DUF397 domain-containing protein [Streptomyces sp. SID3343]